MQSTTSIYEQIKQDKKSYPGVTLSYKGALYTPDHFEQSKYVDPNPNLSPLATFTERFKNIGALVIRFHLGQGQRAGLLQQVAEFDYRDNPVERPAHGDDEANLFFSDVESTHPKAVGQSLEFISHLPLGRSKLLNERAQPLVHVNRQGTYGEQGLWDILHAPVWNVGRNLRYELTKQGFIYLTCPAEFSPKDRALLDNALRTSGKPFALVVEQFAAQSQTAAISKLRFYMDDKQEFTREANGLAIATDKEFAPLGWIIHEKTGDILPQEITEDIIRVSALAEGGFYEKRPTQQKLLQSGNLVNSSGLGLFIQNQAFNAMYVIFDYLQQYPFDPRPLLDTSLQVVYNRLQAALKDDPSVIDDFLTGALQDEMVQPLKVSQPRSKRTVLPVRFTNPFVVIDNNLKAIAYAFELKDSAGQPVFRPFDDMAVIEQHDHLIDVKLNGMLVLPSFNTGSHVASVLSTALLVAEQMIVEQLLSDAVTKGSDSDFNTLLKALPIKDTNVLSSFMALLANFPEEDKKPVLGAQFDYCQPVLQYLRKLLNFDKLPGLICRFAEPGVSTEAILNQLKSEELDVLCSALKMLYLIGNKLQEFPLTSAQSAASRGINAGLEPLIARLFPSLAKELSIDLTHKRYAEVDLPDPEKMKKRLLVKNIDKCPFFSQKTKGPLLEEKQHGLQASQQETKAKSDSTPPSPGFFSRVWEHKGTIGIIVGTAATVAGLISQM
ncbi:Dot/Icm T4SS effector Ceg17 [Legionella taurinensis]|uniref:Uncharacterized protein n=1 Tax=Legionella taurinensis TaxID=70611 RepID=A0A3A5L578_9GAMM|nr:Dot/Icm T4SS effector Ceg17 [Legionella taurinensis]RJT47933.1 hypothetical protein D6J04_05010 [Legionella taurinensis]RJT68147.1 hypothetical protein D6J03_05135 [Legionella taurinensis]STY25678.1 Uncharacterised protein [Legionella taurinensis]